MRPDTLNPIPSAQLPTPGSHMMVSLSPFLGHFVAKGQHATLPMLYHICFHVFKDAASSQILLSIATSERLGILEFKVFNLMAQSYSKIDNLSVPSSAAPGSLRKTAKHVTFCDPLIDLDKPCSTPHTQGLSGLWKTAAHKVSFQGSSSAINGTKHKSPANPSPSPYQPLNSISPTPLT